MNIKLKIDDGRKIPYEVSFDTIFPRTSVPQFQPGVIFPVKIDPTNPNIVVVDTKSSNYKYTSKNKENNFRIIN